MFLNPIVVFQDYKKMPSDLKGTLLKVKEITHDLNHDLTFGEIMKIIFKFKLRIRFLIS